MRRRVVKTGGVVYSKATGACIFADEGEYDKDAHSVQRQWQSIGIGSRGMIVLDWTKNARLGFAQQHDEALDRATVEFANGLRANMLISQFEVSERRLKDARTLFSTS